MRELIKMVLVLSLIGTISGYGLAALKQATRADIEEQVLTYVQGPALLGVLAGVENDPIKDRRKLSLEDGGEITVFPGFRGGRLTSLAFETFAPGYSGNIGVMVAFDLDADTVSAVGVTTQSETPGVGTRVFVPGFYEQFEDHPLTGLGLKKDNGDIDAVSGATFSSAGTVNAVGKAAELYPGLKEKARAAWNG
ncbi:RnfABCDGE type electron transport complex subunit G [Paucidesulfovibrio longus]|uniref:RnfABCDGE type electron transport complex subunit G n=1 Tax=Paucidesulfovibrio longus TaxID=889 RepID=UPI0003B6F4E0|nr:FMN-binding protein [Paucidesulfovibrio longus]